MKFFLQAVGKNESDNELSNRFVDCCLSSPTMIIEFLKTLETKKLSSSAALNYVKGIADMVDFRNFQGLSNNNLRQSNWSLLETRERQNLRKKKIIDFYLLGKHRRNGRGNYIPHQIFQNCDYKVCWWHRNRFQKRIRVLHLFHQCAFVFESENVLDQWPFSSSQFQW